MAFRLARYKYKRATAVRRPIYQRKYTKRRYTPVRRKITYRRRYGRSY